MENSEEESRIPPKRKTLAVIGSVAFVAGGLFFLGFSTSESGSNIFKGATALITETFRDIAGQGRELEPVFEVSLDDYGGGPQKQAPLEGSSLREARVSDVRPPELPKRSEKQGKSGGEGGIAKENTSPTPPKAPEAPKKGSKEEPLPEQECAFFGGGSPSQRVLLNEIAWMGSPPKTGESASAAANNEWIELKNSSKETISLAGWRIADQAEKLAIAFGSGDVLGPRNLYLLERTDDDSVLEKPADKIYSGGLSNNGAWLRLFNERCELVDEVNALEGWMGGDNATKQTLERASDGTGWHTSAHPGGTPKETNSIPPQSATPPQTTSSETLARYSLGVSLQGSGSGIVTSAPSGISCGIDCSEEFIPGTSVALSASPASNSAFDGWSGACAGGGTCAVTLSQNLSVVAMFRLVTPPQGGSAAPVPAVWGGIVITEVQIAGAGNDNDFIKIYNRGSSAADVSGWKLRKKTQPGTDYSVRVFPSGSVVPAGGSFLWANSEGGFSESIGANTSSTQTLAKDNSAALFDAAGGLVDAVAWGSGHVGPYVEGSAYPTNPGASQVLRRKLSGGVPQDTNDNASDFEL